MYIRDIYIFVLNLHANLSDTCVWHKSPPDLSKLERSKEKGEYELTMFWWCLRVEIVSKGWMVVDPCLGLITFEILRCSRFLVYDLGTRGLDLPLILDLKLAWCSYEFSRERESVWGRVRPRVRGREEWKELAKTSKVDGYLYSTKSLHHTWHNHDNLDLTKFRVWWEEWSRSRHGGDGGGEAKGDGRGWGGKVVVGTCRFGAEPLTSQEKFGTLYILG